MNILYYGFDGSGSYPILGWTLIVVSAIIIIVSLIILITDRDIESILTVIIGGLLLFCGITCFGDDRIPVVKATIDDTVLWCDITENYELKSQEGDIYTFKVLNTTIEEWEAFLKEHYNE